jgi:DNA-binding CsgD family transcriptional regulator
MKPLPNSAEIQLADSLRNLGSPGFETSLWHLFRRVAAPDNLLILAYRDVGPPQVLYSQSTQPKVFAQLQATYLAGAYQLDPFYDMHLTRAPAGAYRLRDVAPDAFQRSRYFIEYYDQTTLIDEISFVAYPATGVSLNLCLGRDTSSAQPFLAREVEACQRIAPIICALADAHWAGLISTPGPAGDLSAALARAIKSAHNIHLSPRQAAVAVLILRGHSTASIALRLGISAQTVKVFRKQLYGRCQLSSQAELFALMLPLLKKSV